MPASRAALALALAAVASRRVAASAPESFLPPRGDALAELPHTHGNATAVAPASASASAVAAVFGDGIVEWKSDGSTVDVSNAHCDGQSTSCAIQWVTNVPSVGMALLIADGRIIMADRKFETIWSASLSQLSTPAGGVYFEGKLYVACFGEWPDAKGKSGLAIVDPTSGSIEAEIAYNGESTSHVHNVYAFKWSNKTEIFVALLGNPWGGKFGSSASGAVPGAGLVRFDRNSQQFVVNTTDAPNGLNARSAAQQDDGTIFVITQEPRGELTVLAALKQKGDKFALEARTILPEHDAGDGGADVFLGTEANEVFCTDRGVPHGKLYNFHYACGSLRQLGEARETGPNPRYTTLLKNGTVVSCDQDDGSLTLFLTKTAPGENADITGMDRPMFFIEM